LRSMEGSSDGGHGMRPRRAPTWRRRPRGGGARLQCGKGRRTTRWENWPARPHAKEQGKCARAPRERKERGRGRCPAGQHCGEDTVRGSGPRLELGARVTGRGWKARERGKGRRESARERGAVGWGRPSSGTRWQGEEDRAATGGQPGGGAHWQ
jgi:hypothetical protein